MDSRGNLSGHIARAVFILWILFARTVIGAVIEGKLDASSLTSQDYTTTRLILVKHDLSINAFSIDTHIAYLRKDGSFAFSNVTQGVYTLTIESISFAFDSSFRIDVEEQDEAVKIDIHKVFWGHDFVNDLGPSQPHPLALKPIQRVQYIIERPQFSILSMLKSPMMLMSLGSLVVVFVMPKLMANMDPETLKQVQEQQMQSNTAMNKVQNFDMASYLAEKSSSSSTSSSSSKPAGAQKRNTKKH
jgi:hypothetical protein